MLTENIESLLYQVNTRLLEYTLDGLIDRNPNPKSLAKAVKIRYLLLALENGTDLSTEEKDQIYSCLAQLGNINDFPAVPSISNFPSPDYILQLVGVTVGGDSNTLVAENGVLRTGNVIKLGGNITEVTQLTPTIGSLLIGNTHGLSTTPASSGLVSPSKSLFSINDGFVFTDSGDGSGLVYAADYSATFLDRSLVDKGFVIGLTDNLQSQINAITPVALDYENGVQLQGATVTLGGTLTAERQLQNFGLRFRDAYTEFDTLDGSGSILTLKSGTSDNIKLVDTPTDTTLSVSRDGLTFDFDVSEATNKTFINISPSRFAYQHAGGLYTIGMEFDSDDLLRYTASTSLIPILDASVESNVLVTKGWASTRLASQPVNNIMVAPTAGQNNYSVVWDDTAGEYTLANIAASGGGSFSLTNGNATIAGATSVNLGGLQTANIAISGSNYNFSITGSNVITFSGSGVELSAGDVLLSFNEQVTGKALVVDTRVGANATGLEYSSDLSSNFVANSLISKLYADSFLGGKALASSITNPQAADDGKVVSWNDNTEQYELVVGGSGGSLPSGGVAGDLLVKNSATIGDASWRALLLSDISDVTASATEVNYLLGVTSNVQTQLSGKQATITGGATTITTTDLTASRALVSSVAGKVDVSAVTATELGYVSGVTSAIQPQINSKLTYGGSATPAAESLLVFRGGEWVDIGPGAEGYVPKIVSGVVTWAVDATGGSGSIPSGGTTRQSLLKTSNSDFDIGWYDLLISDISGAIISVTELNSLDNISGNVQTLLDQKQAVITGAASTVTASDLAASRAVVSDVSGKIAASATTAAEIGFVSGVTSSIQTQLNGKQATITGGATTITSSNLTASRALVSDSSGKVAVSVITSTELGYLDNVTSNIQTQLNARLVYAGTAPAANQLLWNDGLGWKNLSGGTEGQIPKIVGGVLTWANDETGAAGGLPIGGTTNQYLKKISNANYDVGWDTLTLSDVTDVTASAAEVNFLSGVTSNVQTQLNGKQATITGGATTITSSNLTINRALISNASGKVAVSTTTSTELGYLSGVTSAVQTQLNARLVYGGTAPSTGDLIVFSAGNWVNFGIGAEGKILKVVGGVPSWEDDLVGGGGGLPIGGTTGQYLRKSSATNYDAAWDTLTLSDVTDVTATAAQVNFLVGVTSNVQTQLNGKQATITGGASSITSVNLTANRALVSDGSGKVAVSAITSTELGYLDGVTSNLQDQLNTKQAIITGAATTVTSANLTTNRMVISNSSGKLAASTRVNINASTLYPEYSTVPSTATTVPARLASEQFVTDNNYVQVVAVGAAPATLPAGQGVRIIIEN